MTESVIVGGKKLGLSNLDKALYPSGFTKSGVIDYYTKVAPTLLPYLKGRAVTLKRYPNGSAAPFFFEKNCAAHRPPWVKTAKIVGRTGSVTHCLVNDVATLVWVANLAALELHVPLALARENTKPTCLAFDLDPGQGADIRDCCRVGMRLRDLFEQLGLESFAKTSGSKGLHVYVPLNSGNVDFEKTKTFAHGIALLFEKQNPESVTSSMNKQLRQGKVFIDWSQNDQHKTTVCVYSLRAKDSPTVSAPVSWREVAKTAKAPGPEGLMFTPKQTMDRISKFGDLFEPVRTLKQKLPKLAVPVTSLQPA